MCIMVNRKPCSDVLKGFPIGLPGTHYFGLCVIIDAGLNTKSWKGHSYLYSIEVILPHTI